jgi:predicted membrane channel-forming protein YqfA (hemolysin III family)
MMNTVVPVVVFFICFSNVLAFDFAWKSADVEALVWVFVFLTSFLLLVCCFVLYNGSVRDQSATLVFLIFWVLDYWKERIACGSVA